MFLKRLYSSLNSSILPLNTLHGGKLKIYSSLQSGGLRLSNGFRHITGGLAVIGSGHYNWNCTGNPVASITALLNSIRPIPEFIVISSGTNKISSLSTVGKEFGCSLQVFEDKMKAASTFNTLIDDDRQAIFLYH